MYSFHLCSFSFCHAIFQALGWHTKNIGTEKSTCLDAAEFKYEGGDFAGSSYVDGEASGIDM